MGKHLIYRGGSAVVEKHSLNKVLVVLGERYVELVVNRAMRISICPEGFKKAGILLTTVLHLEFDYTTDLRASN